MERMRTVALIVCIACMWSRVPRCGSLAEPAVPGGERVVRVVRPLLLEQPQGRRVALWLLAWPR